MAVGKVSSSSDVADIVDRHIPVLLEPMLAKLSPKDDEIYVDGTFGAGGYSRAILEAANCRVIGIDQDPDAVRDARPLLREFGPRLEVVHGRYSKMAEHLKALKIEAVDGVVLDIGVSSMQIDQQERGFSFRNNGPLDMRMSQSGPTAADLVNGLTETELADVLYLFGEERKSRHIARAIVERRIEAPFQETADLAQLIEKLLPRKHSDKIHPATRSFQALRIYLNDELGELLRGLNGAAKILKPGGRLVVVSFHSLEDRIVKTFLRVSAGRVPNQSRHLPDLNKETVVGFQIINPRPVKASDEEMRRNPRARSAHLRAGLRTDQALPEYDEAGLGLKSFQL